MPTPGERLNRDPSTAENEFWRRWSSAAGREILDGLAKLEGFGFDDLRFLDGDWPDGRTGYQLTGLLRTGRRLKPVTSQAFEDPREAVRDLSLWLHKQIMSGAHVAPTQMVEMPGEQILGPDGQPLK